MKIVIGKREFKINNIYLLVSLILITYIFYVVIREGEPVENDPALWMSPQEGSNDWGVILVALVGLTLIFFTYRNFSAYRINRNRMNTRRRR